MKYGGAQIQSRILNFANPHPIFLTFYSERATEGFVWGLLKLDWMVHQFFASQASSTERPSGSVIRKQWPDTGLMVIGRFGIGMPAF